MLRRTPGERARAAHAAAIAGRRFEQMSPDEALRTVFKHGGWRELQREVVERVLNGRSTLVVLPTGGGKSLCYQLPALLCTGLVLVVSPLLALIDDQISNLPPELLGAKLTSSQTREQSAAVLASLRADAPAHSRPKVLFVAPERLTCPAFAAVIREVRVAFACVDEAHCVSQWAHHFRPAFLALGRVLHDELRVTCVLALTATATPTTAASVLSSLRIPADGLLARPPARPNLELRAIRVAPSQRLGRLVSLLLHGELRELRPVIVYCGTRIGAEEAAAALRAAGEKSVGTYHAGVALPQRERLHKRFEKGQLPILVATCAFGMGVDLANVRAVVHCGLPRSPEHYVQETGRAGRDGRGGTCVALFDDTDREWLASRAHSAAVDCGAVRRLLAAVFETQRRGGTLPRPVLLRPAAMAVELDMSDETIETVLALLEGTTPPPPGADAANKAAPVLPLRAYALRRADVHGTVELRFDEGTPEEVGANAPLVGFLLRTGKLVRDLAYSCDLGTAAAHFNCSLEDALKQLDALRESRLVRYTLTQRSTHLHVIAEPDDLAALAAQLTATLRARDGLESARVGALYDMMCRAAEPRAACGCLAAELATYFADEGGGPGGARAPPPRPAAGRAPQRRVCADAGAAGEDDDDGADGAAAGADVARGMDRTVERQYREMQYANAAVTTFVRSHQHAHKLTDISVARVLHGISSVGYPAVQWRQSPHWGKHVGVPFQQLVKLASAALAGPAARRKQQAKASGTATAGDDAPANAS